MATYLSQHLSVSVIIPTRNEAPNLQYVLPHVPDYVDEVILVDGHSTDGTIAEAQCLLPDVRVVEQGGKGKGDAVRDGLRILKLIWQERMKKKVKSLVLPIPPVQQQALSEEAVL